MAIEFPCHRLVAENGTVCVTNWTIKRLDVGAVENAVAQVHRTAGFVADRIRFVMRVRRIQTVQNALLGVGPSTAFAVSHKPKVRRLHHQHPVLVELKTGGTIETIGPGRHLCGLARFGIQIDDQQLVEHLGRGRVFGIIGPRSHPQTSLRIKGHLHWIDELREGFLRGDQFYFAPRWEGQMLNRILSAHIRDRLGTVGGREFHGWEVVVLDRIFLAFGRSPNQRIAVGRQHIALRKFLSKNLRIGDARIRNARTSPKNVVLVYRTIAMMPLDVFLQHGGPERFERCIHGRVLTKYSLELHGSEGLITLFGEMDSVNGQRMSCLRKNLLGGRKQVNELDPVGLGDIRHRLGIQRQIGVVRRAIRKMRAL